MVDSVAADAPFAASAREVSLPVAVVLQRGSPVAPSPSPSMSPSPSSTPSPSPSTSPSPSSPAKLASPASPSLSQSPSPSPSPPAKPATSPSPSPPDKPWAAPQWTVFAVIAGENLPRANQAVVIHDDGACRRTLHGGLTLDLRTDGGEGYWVNLLSDAPYLFVVCDEVADAGGDLRPAFITANRDEANGYLEAERVVLPAPMPATVCDVVERYVLSHYRPAMRKKRARREWAEESEYANRPA